MRLCHVITKPELGGAQLSTLNILSGLPKDKYKVFLITSPEGVLSAEFKDLSGVSTFFSPFLVRPLNPLYDILAFIHILSIYRRYKIALVHTHSSKAGIIGRWAARFSGVNRIIHTVHGWSFNDYQHFFIRSFFILLERVTARFTTKIICVSRKDLETGLKYKIAPKEKFELIKYGILLEEFRRPRVDKLEKRKELGIRNNDPVVGMIACLKPQKSPLDYIKASIKVYQEMPHVNFLLIGDGVLKSDCESTLASSPLNGRFIFAGWRRDISEILDVLDLVVLTSKWEGMPITLIEALCKGCPIVATNVGGAAELIKEGVTGYLTKPGEYQETAEYILKILEDSDTLRKMKKEASLSIDSSFDMHRMLNEVEGLYREIK